MSADHYDNNYRPHRVLAIIYYRRSSLIVYLEDKMSNALLEVQLLNIQDEKHREMLSAEIRFHEIMYLQVIRPVVKQLNYTRKRLTALN